MTGGSMLRTMFQSCRTMGWAGASIGILRRAMMVSWPVGADGKSGTALSSPTRTHPRLTSRESPLSVRNARSAWYTSSPSTDCIRNRTSSMGR